MSDAELSRTKRTELLSALCKTPQGLPPSDSDPDIGGRVLFQLPDVLLIREGGGKDAAKEQKGSIRNTE